MLHHSFVGVGSGFLVDAFKSSLGVGVVFLLSGSILVCINVIMLVFGLTRYETELEEETDTGSEESKVEHSSLQLPSSLSANPVPISAVLANDYTTFARTPVNAITRPHVLKRSLSAPSVPVLKQRNNNSFSTKKRMPVFQRVSVGRGYQLSRHQIDSIRFERLKQRARANELLQRRKERLLRRNNAVNVDTQTAKEYTSMTQPSSALSLESTSDIADFVLHKETVITPKSHSCDESPLRSIVVEGEHNSDSLYLSLPQKASNRLMSSLNGNVDVDTHPHIHEIDVVMHDRLDRMHETTHEISLSQQLNEEKNQTLHRSMSSSMIDRQTINSTKNK